MKPNTIDAHGAIYVLGDIYDERGIRIATLEAANTELAAKLKTALETLNDARWFNATACLTGDECPHKNANECLEAICADADNLGEQIQAVIDAAAADQSPDDDDNYSLRP